MPQPKNTRDHLIAEHVFGAPETTPSPPLQRAPGGSEILTDKALLAMEPTNDTGNAKRLLAYFGDNLLHVREIGWHEWTGRHWEREGGDEFATRCAQETASLIQLEADFITANVTEKQAIENGEQATCQLTVLNQKSRNDWNHADDALAAELRSKITIAAHASEAVKRRQIARRKFAVTSGNSSKIFGMLTQAIPHRTVMPESLDADPLAFNCLNGTIIFSKVDDLECPDPDHTRKIGHVEIRAHDRSDLMTKCAPVEYVPSAECSNFIAFIEKFQPNSTVRSFLQSYLGYAITGLTGEQIMLFSYGLGANGKSTLIDIICRILGGYAQTLSFETLADEGFGRRGDQATPDLVRLPGARLVRASEPKRGVRLNEAMIKSLTGGEPMLVRDLHKKFFEFHPDFKLVLSGNHKPEISGGDHGIWRRVCLLPWDVTIPKEDQRPFAEISAIFWKERSGILNWLIDGAKNYLTHGLIIPSEVKTATEQYREEMDPIQMFVWDCILKNDTTRNDQVAARTMYRAYEEWCEVNAHRAYKENAFGRALPQKGIERERRGGRSIYLGVRLNPERPVIETACKTAALKEEYAPV